MGLGVTGGCERERRMICDVYVGDVEREVGEKLGLRG